MTEIPLLLFTGLIILFIATNAKARDVARAHITAETRMKHLVFLDDSIALKSLSIKRIAGKLGFYRSYAFEFNASDFQRYQGKVELLGYKITNTQFFHPDHIDVNQKNKT